MENKESIVKTGDDIDLFIQSWQVSRPVGTIGIVHGLGDHSGRYRHVAKFFSEHRFNVIAYDRRGHGKSGGKRGHADSFDVLLDEVSLLVVESEKEWGDTPFFLYGHSQGGNLVLNYLLRRNPEIAGVISTDPWIRLAFEAPAVKVFFAKLLRPFFPSLTQPNTLNINHLSRDTAVVEAYKNDPLVHDRISLAMGLEMIEAARFLDEFSGTANLPLLLMHGGADQITSAQASADFAARLSGDVTFQLWKDSYHEIHNEPNQGEVMQFILDWMKQRI